MSQSGQTYANHRRFFPPYHFVVLPVLLINFILAARSAWMIPSAATGFNCALAAALFAAPVLSRMMILSVQDRVIRLEMRMRLRQILPSDLQSRINDLTREQLVALRFAGDAEMPQLIRQVLGGQLKSQSDIKKQVTDWQGDYLRA